MRGMAFGTESGIGGAVADAGGMAEAGLESLRGAPKQAASANATANPNGAASTRPTFTVLTSPAALPHPVQQRPGQPQGAVQGW